MFNNNLKWMFLSTIYFTCSLLLIISPVINAQGTPTVNPIASPTASIPATTNISEAELNNLNSLLDPVYYVGLLENKTVPGTENYKNKCYFVSTPRPEDNKTIPNTNQQIQWTCPAGNFCMSPNKTVPCTPGFICPENSAQPVYCCQGYFCSEDASEIHICPEGFFCTLGSVKPISCHYLAFCPEGSKNVNRYYISGIILLGAFIIVVLFAVNNRANQTKTAKYRKLLLEQKMSHSMSLDPVKRTFDLEFENIGLVLPSGVSIMEGVSGKLEHGRTCAIMGPSGAGKTTFVSLLTGKAKKTSGIIRVNGVEESLSKYQKLIGFVPQEDVMLRELTVREILVHSAMMRLPSDMDRAAKKQKVIETIRFLELSHVMDSIIGNEEQRGISGGQRKRVNIGMELVAEPSILFLDEPTSGLDSSTSFEVCTLLKNIAHKQGLLVGAVIHSPSPQAFETFDDFLLLGKGGKIIYFGPRERALEYFANLGFECPREESPADFMMEVASGKVKATRGIDIDLFRAWEEYRTGGKTSIFYGSDEKAKLVPHVELDMDHEKQPSSTFWQKIKFAFLSFHIPFMHLITDDPIRETPNVFVAFTLLFKRACLQLYRNRTQFLLDQLLHLGCGAFISLAVSNFTYIGKAPKELCYITPYVVIPACVLAKDNLQSVGMLMSLGVTFAGISGGGSTFGYEKVVYWRDTAAGMKTIPYFLSKLIADIPRMLIAAAMFSCSFILFYPFRALFSETYIIILLSYFSAWTMGYFLSAIVAKEKLGLIATGFALGWGLVLSGVNPKLDEVMSNDSYEYIRWIWSISAPRWEIEALYLKEIFPRKWAEIHSESLNFTYNFDEYLICLRNIAIIAVGWGAAAFFAMKLINRDKQK